MIYIYTVETDITVNYIIDWLNYYRKPYRRINSHDFFSLFRKDFQYLLDKSDVHWFWKWDFNYHLVDSNILFNNKNFNVALKKECRILFDLYFRNVHNVIYNKRIFIDGNGFVKNTLNGLILGHIVDGEIVNNEQIKIYWNVNKDIVEHCNICEHRYMCYDSRVPFFDGEKWYYKTDCGYNPYLCKWKWEKGFRSLNG